MVSLFRSNNLYFISYNTMRQGDISFKKVSENLTKGKQLTKPYVLKHGESGNKHMLIPVVGSEVIFDDSSLDNIRFKVKKGKAVLKHGKTVTSPLKDKDHKYQVFEVGIYSMFEEREINPFTQEINKVID